MFLLLMTTNSHLATSKCYTTPYHHYRSLAITVIPTTNDEELLLSSAGWIYWCLWVGGWVSIVAYLDRKAMTRHDHLDFYHGIILTLLLFVSLTQNTAPSSDVLFRRVLLAAY